MKSTSIFLCLSMLPSLNLLGSVNRQLKFSTATTKTFKANNIVEDFRLQSSQKNAISSSNSIVSMKHRNLNSNTYNDLSIPYNSNGQQIINGKYTTTSWFNFSNNVRRSGFGADNRKNIDYLCNYLPVSSIGVVYNSFNGVYHYGSGFLIGNGLVITSAHVLYNFDTKVYAENCDFYLGYIDGDNYKDVVKITDYYIPNQYIKNGKKENDWAVIRLNNDNMTKKYGAVTIASQCSLKNRTYQSIGTPADKSVGLYYESTAYDVVSETGNVYYTYAYLYKGMSGGPLIAQYTEIDEQDVNRELEYYYIAGINQGGENIVSSGFICYAVKITNELIGVANYIL